jgi:hypothetical protein
MTRPKREEWPRGHCPRTDLQMHPISYQHWVAEAAYFEDRLALCRHHHEQYTEAQHVALRVSWRDCPVHLTGRAQRGMAGKI